MRKLGSVKVDLANIETFLAMLKATGPGEDESATAPL
jgi:hypothetical protein